MHRPGLFLTVVLMAAAVGGAGATTRHYDKTHDPGLAPAGGRATGGDVVARVPFELVDDHIVIPVTVNGDLEVDMILDTGWGSPGAILLKPEMGERLGLRYVTVINLGGGGADPGGRTARVTVGGTLAVSGVVFTNQNILVVQQADLFEDFYADAIIGATLFEYIVKIDYEDLVLNFYEELTGALSDYGHPFALDYSFGIPVMHASILTAGGETVPVTLLADTGVNDPLLVFGFSDDRLATTGPTIEGVEGILSEGISGQILGSIGRIRTLEMGPFVVNDVVASYPSRESWGAALQLGQDGMLGNEVLQQFDVVFDYLDDRMFLKPNSRYGRAFDYNMAGLVMRGEENACKILDVIADSPAWSEGIRGGDRLVAVDGRAVADHDGPEIGRIFTREGSTVRVTIERNGERFERSLRLRRLI